MKRVTISPECVTDSKQLKKIKKKKERKKSVVFPSVTISRWFPTLFQRMRLLRLTNCREQSSLESFIGDELVERKLNRKLILYNNLNSIEFTCKVNEGFWIQWPIMVGLKTKNNSIMFIQCFYFLYALQFHPYIQATEGFEQMYFFPECWIFPVGYF